MPPLRGWNFAGFIPRLCPEFSCHALSKALAEKKSLIAALKALRHPKASFQQV
jgi:hypothetical protein